MYDLKETSTSIMNRLAVLEVNAEKMIIAMLG